MVRTLIFTGLAVAVQGLTPKVAFLKKHDPCGECRHSGDMECNRNCEERHRMVDRESEPKHEEARKHVDHMRQSADLEAQMKHENLEHEEQMQHEKIQMQHEKISEEFRGLRDETNREREDKDHEIRQDEMATHDQIWKSIEEQHRNAETDCLEERLRSKEKCIFGACMSNDMCHQCHQEKEIPCERCWSSVHVDLDAKFQPLFHEINDRANQDWMQLEKDKQQEFRTVSQHEHRKIEEKYWAKGDRMWMDSDKKRMDLEELKNNERMETERQCEHTCQAAHRDCDEGICRAPMREDSHHTGPASREEFMQECHMECPHKAPEMGLEPFHCADMCPQIATCIFDDHRKIDECVGNIAAQHHQSQGPKDPHIQFENFVKQCHHDCPMKIMEKGGNAKDCGVLCDMIGECVVYEHHPIDMCAERAMTNYKPHAFAGSSMHHKPAMMDDPAMHHDPAMHMPHYDDPAMHDSANMHYEDPANMHFEGSSNMHYEDPANMHYEDPTMKMPHMEPAMGSYMDPAMGSYMDPAMGSYMDSAAMSTSMPPMEPSMPTSMPPMEPSMPTSMPPMEPTMPTSMPPMEPAMPTSMPPMEPAMSTSMPPMEPAMSTSMPMDPVMDASMTPMPMASLPPITLLTKSKRSAGLRLRK